MLQGENVDCRLYLVENNTIRHVIIAISENMRIMDREGNEMDKPFGYSRDKQWRKLTKRRFEVNWLNISFLLRGPDFHVCVL